MSEPGAESLGERVRRYILTGDDEDLKRLLVVSDVMTESARTALGRSGVGAGASVIECGCGPVGALPILSELVGPGGRVVGIDMNPPRWNRPVRSLTHLASTMCDSSRATCTIST